MILLLRPFIGPWRLEVSKEYEFTAFPYEINNATEELYLVGDHKQTRILEPSEGKPCGSTSCIYSRIAGKFQKSTRHYTVAM